MKLYVGSKEVVPSNSSDDEMAQQFWAGPDYNRLLSRDDWGCTYFEVQVFDYVDCYALRASLRSAFPHAERTALLPCEGKRISKAQAAPYRPPKRRRT